MRGLHAGDRAFNGSGDTRESMSSGAAGKVFSDRFQHSALVHLATETMSCRTRFQKSIIHIFQARTILPTIALVITTVLCITIETPPLAELERSGRCRADRYLWHINTM
jgi:hypothetical protein